MHIRLKQCAFLEFKLHLTARICKSKINETQEEFLLKKVESSGFLKFVFQREGQLRHSDRQQNLLLAASWRLRLRKSITTLLIVMSSINIHFLLLCDWFVYDYLSLWKCIILIAEDRQLANGSVPVWGSGDLDRPAWSGQTRMSSRRSLQRRL